MRNADAYAEIQNHLNDKIELCKKEIASWKAVGTNYKRRNDGRPFADICKSFDGVDGVDKVWCLRHQRNSNWWTFCLRNSRGFVITVDNGFYPSTETVEKAIQNKITSLENDLQAFTEAISHTEKIIEKCDEAASILLSVCENQSETAKKSTWWVCAYYLQAVLNENGMSL